MKFLKELKFPRTLRNQHPEDEDGFEYPQINKEKCMLLSMY